MRLIKDEGQGELSLVEYYDDKIPRYAILSHTWGEDGEEVTFKDLMEDTGKNKIGYKKIEFCRDQAASDGLQFFWIDTCCIDKSSSAELSEAINSMFRWYENADKCYVYLSDVSTSGHVINVPSSPATWEAAFQKSRWFSRGWTLQELIAPTSVEFFSSEGDLLGSKRSLEQCIREITGIAIPALRGGPLTRFEVEERFSWAKHRQTKRPEDKAYSLFGIFNVHMPLLYGEGREKAFERLREEIGKSSKSPVTAFSTDLQSILTLQKEQKATLQEQKLSLDAIEFLFARFQEEVLQRGQLALVSASESNRGPAISTKKRRRRIDSISSLDLSSCSCLPERGVKALNSFCWRIFQKESETFFIHDRDCPIRYKSERNSKYRVDFVLFERLRIFGSVDLRRFPYAGVSGWSLSQDLRCHPVVPSNAPPFQVLRRYLTRPDPTALDYCITKCLRDLRVVFQSGLGSPRDTLESGSNLIDMAWAFLKPSYFDCSSLGFVVLLRLTKGLIELGIEFKPDGPQNHILGPLSSLMHHIFRGLSIQCTEPSVGEVKPMAQDALNLLSWIMRQEFDLSLPNGFVVNSALYESRAWHGFHMVLSAQRENEDFQAAVECGILSVAVLQRHEVTVRTILEQRPNLLGSEQNKFGQSPIHLAVGWPTGLKILLAAADESTLDNINSLRGSQGTPLDCAIAVGCVESMAILADAEVAFDFEWSYRIGTKFLDPTVEATLFDLILKRLRQLHDFGLQSLPVETVKSLQIEDFKSFDAKAKSLLDYLNMNNIRVPTKFHGHLFCFCPEFGGIFHQLGIHAETAKLFFEAGFHNVDHEAEQLTPLMCLESQSRGRREFRISNFFKNVEFFVQKGAHLDKKLPSRYIKGFTLSKRDTDRQHRVIHRVASLCWSNLYWNTNRMEYMRIATELGSTNIWREILGSTSSDPCICACSIDGCRPISLALKLSLRHGRPGLDWKDMFDPREWTRTVDYLSDLGLLLENSQGEQLVNDVIRFLTFSALGLTHTCCNHERYFLYDYRDFTPMMRLMDTSEVEEIHEEQAFLIDRLDRLVEGFLKEFDELALPLPEFLELHWQKRILAELLQRDEIPEIEKEQLQEMGVTIQENNAEDSEDGHDHKSKPKSFLQQRDDDHQNFVSGYDEWFQGIERSIR